MPGEGERVAASARLGPYPGMHPLGSARFKLPSGMHARVRPVAQWRIPVSGGTDSPGRAVAVQGSPGRAKRHYRWVSAPCKADAGGSDQSTGD